LFDHHEAPADVDLSDRKSDRTTETDYQHVYGMRDAPRRSPMTEEDLDGESSARRKGRSEQEEIAAFGASAGAG
jgi:hypothetical protein